MVGAASLQANLPAPPGQPPPDPMEEYKYINDHLPGYYVCVTGTMLFSFLGSALLVIAGIGLLKMRRWARSVSIGYAIVDILVTIASSVYTIVLVNPLAVEHQAEVSKRTPGVPSPGPGFTYSVTILTFITSVAYPVAILICMYLPRVRAAFARAARPEGEEDDRYPDEEDDRPDILDRPAGFL
jgi:hypothetical protein